jgi:hypothetical protein
MESSLSHDTNGFPSEEPPSVLKLRRLIGKMTMTEKTTFKRYIRNYRDNNKNSKYIKFFDCINDCQLDVEQEVKSAGTGTNPGAFEGGIYERIKTRYRLRKISNPRDMPAKAHYLYEKILESLRQQGIDQNLRRELYARMLDIQLLFNKEMHEECLSIIRSTQKIAEQLEALPQLIELSLLERNVLLQTARGKVILDMRSLYDSEQIYLEQLRATSDFDDLRNESLLALRGGAQIEKEDLFRAKINRFLQYINAAKPFNSFDLGVSYHAIRAYLIWIDLQHPTTFLRSVIKEHEGWKSIVDHFKSIVDLYDRHLLRKSDAPHRYRVHLLNYLTLALGHGFKVDIAPYQNELGKIHPSDPAFLSNVIFINLLSLAVDRRFKEAKDYMIKYKLAETIGMHGPKIPPSRLQTIQNLAGQTCFIREEFAEAGKWFEANSQIEADIQNREIQTAGLIYRLLCRFEIGFSNSRAVAKELLEPLLKVLDNMDDPNSFESALYHTLYELLKTNPKGEKLKKLAEERLPILQERLKGKMDISHNDLFIAWLESKKQGKPLRFFIDKYI